MCYNFIDKDHDHNEQHWLFRETISHNFSFKKEEKVSKLLNQKKKRVSCEIGLLLV